MTNADYRSLPSVDRLLADPALVELAAVYGQQRVTAQVRAALDAARRSIAGGAEAPDAAANGQPASHGGPSQSDGPQGNAPPAEYGQNHRDSILRQMSLKAHAAPSSLR